MYIVKQKVYGKDYYYLRRSVREGDKVISKNMAYLGKNKKEAEEKAKEIIEKIGKGENIDNIKNKELDNSVMDEETEKLKNIEELSNFCKEKGFVFKSSEI